MLNQQPWPVTVTLWAGYASCPTAVISVYKLGTRN
jgi:hypothetical protein